VLRLLGILVTVLCAIGAAILTWPQFFHVERTWPIAQAVAFRGVVVLGFAALVLLMLLVMLVRPLRAFAASIALIALLAGAANAAIVYTRGVSGDALPAKADGSLRVMTWNTAGAATDPETIARTAVAMQADIVTLPETTIETGEQVAVTMRKLGHRMWAYNKRYTANEWDSGSTTVLISPALGDYAVVDSTSEGTTNTSTVPSVVAMPVDGTGPIIVAAHAVAPRQSYIASWTSDLRWIADQCAADDVILAGDFNATLDHMSALGVEGGNMGRCRDAAAQTGSGGIGTWPSGVPALLGAPIDHVMATDKWVPVGSVVLTSLDGSGSDHRPVVVQLDPAG